MCLLARSPLEGAAQVSQRASESSGSLFAGPAGSFSSEPAFHTAGDRVGNVGE